VVFMKESDMRFSYCLVLGLTVALVSGCSHCDHCRNSIQKRFAGRHSVYQQSVGDRGYTLDSPIAPCACGNAPTRYEHFAPPVVEMGVSELNAPVEPETSIVEPETPIVVPELPSSRLQENNGGAPKLEGTFEPAKDDTGFLSPSRLTPRKLILPPGQPQVAESPVSRLLPESTALEPNRSNLVPPVDGQNVSVLQRDRKRLNATLVSSRKNPTDTPRVIHEAKPVPLGLIIDGQADEVEISKTQRPEFAEQPQSNVVLQSRPDPTRPDSSVFGTDQEPAPQHLSVADASTVDHYGLPDGSTVPFEQLPPIQGARRNVPLGFPTADESRLEEPPLDNLVPNFRSLPEMSPKDDKFTSTTSYQAPTRDETYGHRASDFIEVQNSNGRPSQPDDLKAIQQRVDSVFRIVPGSSAPPVRQVQILRLRAATPLDQTAKIPPIVSINVDELIIVRGGIHPDVKSPLENVESPYSTIPSRPIFDEKRLESSIRGLSARPDSESTTKPTTIER
jgi:hypothetical protein